MIRILGWYLAVFVFISCGSSKEILQPEIGEEVTQAQVVEALKARNYNYTWINGKAKAKINTPEENASGLMYLRNPKDSLIWLVVKKRSAEAARILMRPDSMFVIYRLENTYEKKSIEEIRKTINLDLTFGELQDLVAGKVPMPNNNSLNVGIFKDSINVTGKYKNITLHYSLDPLTLRLMKAIYTNKDGKKIFATFDQYKQVKDKGEIPYFRSYEFTSAEGERSYIELEIIDIEFDKPARILFQIPDHYDEVY